MTTTNTRTVSERVEDTIHRLETYCRRMERRYEVSSAFAAEAARNGYLKETAEVARWLISYRTLLRLRAAAGLEAGTSTPTTA